MPSRFDYLSSISEKIFGAKYLGFTPTSNSTKPPHIANGLFRECLGEYWDTEMIHKWIVSEQKDNATSSEEIVEEFKSILARKDLENINNIKKLRFLLNEIFNPDNTVYPKLILRHTTFLHIGLYTNQSLQKQKLAVSFLISCQNK